MTPVILVAVVVFCALGLKIFVLALDEMDRNDSDA
jgi:hypothetical protein